MLFVSVYSTQFPGLAWPDASLPEFEGWSLHALGLGFPSLSCGVPSLPRLRLSLPRLTLPALDIDVPDIDLPDVNLPSITLPTIPIPSMGYPSIPFDMDAESCMPSGFIGAFAFAFLLDLLDDVKDFVLIFGKSKVLMRKVVMRKVRAQAKMSIAGAVGGEPASTNEPAARPGKTAKVAPE